MENEKFKKSWGLLSLQDLEKSKDPTDQNHSSDEKIGRKTVEKMGKILDDGYRINGSGSSIDGYRFLYLVKTNSGIKIVELKENNCAGSSRFVSQETDQVIRFESNKKDLLSEAYWETSKVIPLGHASYLLRIKRENPLEGLKKNGKLLKDYGAFYAYTLGRIHSPNANGNYVRGLDKDKEEKKFVKAVNDYVDAYDKSLSSRTKNK